MGFFRRISGILKNTYSKDHVRMTASGFREDEGVHFRPNSAEPLRTFKIYKHKGGYQKRSVA